MNQLGCYCCFCLKWQWMFSCMWWGLNVVIGFLKFGVIWLIWNVLKLLKLKRLKVLIFIFIVLLLLRLKVLVRFRLKFWYQFLKFLGCQLKGCLLRKLFFGLLFKLLLLLVIVLCGVGFVIVMILLIWILNGKV